MITSVVEYDQTASTNTYYKKKLVPIEILWVWDLHFVLYSYIHWSNLFIYNLIWILIDINYHRLSLIIYQLTTPNTNY